MGFSFSVVNTTSKLPVIINLAGGGFRTHGGDDIISGADFLIETGVIVVTFNHRVGPFGFLNLDTPEYSGNMALKDQQMAIEWTHTNIERFGGDKTKITLIGNSSGNLQMANSSFYFQFSFCRSAIDFQSFFCCVRLKVLIRLVIKC